MAEPVRPEKGRRWFATFFASSFLAMGTVQLAVGLITAFRDHDDHTVTGALFMIMALLIALLVRKKWPHVPSDNQMRPATARRVLAVLTAAYSLLAVIALVQGVVDQRGIVAMHVIAFGAVALMGTRVLIKSSRRPRP